MEKRHWQEIKNTYIDEENFCYIDAWKTDDDSEEGKVIAYVDMLTGRIVYTDPIARIDEYAQKCIREVVETAKKNHPVSMERMEELLRSMVAYEMEELPEDTEANLFSIGFSDDEISFFR